MVTVRRNGPSLYMLLRPPILEAMGLKRGDMLRIEVDGQFLCARKVVVGEVMAEARPNGGGDRTTAEE